MEDKHQACNVPFHSLDPLSNSSDHLGRTSFSACKASMYSFVHITFRKTAPLNDFLMCGRY